jgi:hypothetical protein
MNTSVKNTQKRYEGDKSVLSGPTVATVMNLDATLLVKESFGVQENLLKNSMVQNVVEISTKPS